MGLLDGRVVLVSGVGPGLGRSCAAAALREGALVVLGDLDQVRLERLRREIDESGDRTLAGHLDITDDHTCAALVDSARTRFGRIDGVVHVAALDTVIGGLLDGGFEDLQRTNDVNVVGTMRLTREVVPLLQVNGGSIVIINSVGGFRPRPDNLRFAYGTSKGALMTAARYLACELGPDGIRVNTVAPGFKWCPVLEAWSHGEAARRGIAHQQLMDELHGGVALHQLASDDDVADAVVFFLSDLSRKVTGQTLVVDGGGYYH